MKILEKVKKWITPKRVGVTITVGCLIGYANQKRKNRKLREENLRLRGITENQAHQIKGQGKTIERLSYDLGKHRTY